MSNRVIVASVIFAISIFSVNTVHAQDVFQPHWYANLHLGNAATSLNQGPQEFSYLNIGGAFGYRYNEVVSLELFMSYATAGDRDEIVSGLLGQEVNTKFDAVGFYVNAQTRGDYYVKGKAGFVESRFIYESSGYEDESGNNAGFSYGFGAGMRRENVRIELEYLMMPEVDDPLFVAASYDTTMLLLSVGIDLK